MQSFAEVTDMPESFEAFQFDGLIGLSYPSLSVVQMPGVFDNMIQQNLLDEPVFSMLLSRQIFFINFIKSANVKRTDNLLKKRYQHERERRRNPFRWHQLATLSR